MVDMEGRCDGLCIEIVEQIVHELVIRARRVAPTYQACVDAVSFKIKMSYIQMSWACRDDHRETTLFLISKTTLEWVSRKGNANVSIPSE